MKAIALAAAFLVVIASHTAFAGVTPNTAASAAAKSGARIAPTKTETDNKAQGDSAGQSDTAK